LLAAAGAQVVKVELAGRLDGARAGASAFYDHLHSGHDSVLVDVGDTDDRRLLDRLIAAADIVIEASRPRALLSLGIDPIQKCAQTPTTWISITAYGRTLPNQVGFGDDVAMAAGLVARDADGVPMPCADAIADPLTGIHAAVAALASHRVGGSRVIDIAMRDVVAATVAWSPLPTVAAVRSGGEWFVDTSLGPQPVSAPRKPARVPSAAAPGCHTAAWRARLDVAAQPSGGSISPAGR
jgi:crotonobetainyl-CoA:carnitine CoA-transferase CaiB-like acyl-CoA transferase